jgi:NADPH:quinone reductase-like Zn-dependent oxidoreductase
MTTQTMRAVTFEEAAGVCDGFNHGLACLKRAGVGEDTRLLVYGASGSCGTAAVQLGKRYFGAHVTAVCNTKNSCSGRCLSRPRSGVGHVPPPPP